METQFQEVRKQTLTRKTSIEAFNEINENGLLSLRRLQVYNLLYHHGPLTAGEIFDLGLKKNVWSRAVKGGICARLTELRQLGVAEELGEKVCSLSNMTTILWDVTTKLPLKFEKKKRIDCPHCNGRGYFEEQQSRFDV